MIGSAYNAITFEINTSSTGAITSYKLHLSKLINIEQFNWHGYINWIQNGTQNQRNALALVQARLNSRGLPSQQADAFLTLKEMIFLAGEAAYMASIRDKFAIIWDNHNPMWTNANPEPSKQFVCRLIL